LDGYLEAARGGAEAQLAQEVDIEVHSASLLSVLRPYLPVSQRLPRLAVRTGTSQFGHLYGTSQFSHPYGTSQHGCSCWRRPCLAA
jgi:hypothetical protein